MRPFLSTGFVRISVDSFDINSEKGFCATGAEQHGGSVLKEELIPVGCAIVNLLHLCPEFASFIFGECPFKR